MLLNGGERLLEVVVIIGAESGNAFVTAGVCGQMAGDAYQRPVNSLGMQSAQRGIVRNDRAVLINGLEHQKIRYISGAAASTGCYFVPQSASPR